MEYPTRNGIAVSPLELALPHSKYGDKKKYQNNHHSHYTEGRYSRTMATLALRDLERHQYDMPVDVHKYLHDTYGPPEVASERQAALEVIDAYDKAEYFKVYDRGSKQYLQHEIPLYLVDALIAKNGIKRIFDMAAD